ncbi:hypothetical protein QJS10_CPB11g02311 [Acorus calamus]|uniref:Uncharacterized protein n=1 Tax=Acorus calamus TaxID=4465 RepID=A0AAV9DS97_ACOCL|nr:hypothetical protein QJS10_CPB11g02311 [Acorus calamus]
MEVIIAVPLLLGFCRELRDGCLPGDGVAVFVQYQGRGMDYVHGGEPLTGHWEEEKENHGGA